MRKIKCLSIASLLVLMLGCEQLNTTNNLTGFKGGDFLCISLNQFIGEIHKSISDKVALPTDMDSLFGMSWLEGYVVDPENNDIILVGKCLKNKPTYRAEDIIVNFQNVMDSSAAPYCSLDPNPENILKFEKLMSSNDPDGFARNAEKYKDKVGGQKVVVGGVSAFSRHAAIMIYADYDMKKISQGLLKVDGIRSGLEIAAAEKSIFDIKNTSTMSRYWLHIKENSLVNTYPSFNYNDGIVFIKECPVVVLTEKQVIDAGGNLKDAGFLDDDKNARIFANEMSENYDTLAFQNRLFAELENLFRLQACLRTLKYKSEIDNTGIDLTALRNIRLTSGITLPDSLPGLMNYNIVKEEKIKGEFKETSSQLYFVSGGVSQELKIKNKNLSLDNSLAKLNKVVVNSRPNKASSHWTLNIPTPKENKFIKFFEIKK